MLLCQFYSITQLHMSEIRNQKWDKWPWSFCWFNEELLAPNDQVCTVLYSFTNFFAWKKNTLRTLFLWSWLINIMHECCCRPLHCLCTDVFRWLFVNLSTICRFLPGDLAPTWKAPSISLSSTSTFTCVKSFWMMFTNKQLYICASSLLSFPSLTLLIFTLKVLLELACLILF